MGSISKIKLPDNTVNNIKDSRLPTVSTSDKGKILSVDVTNETASYKVNDTIDIGRKANTTVGNRSTAEGISTTASGSYSHAEGFYTTASGNSSHAEGEGTKASGNSSHAEGYDTRASGNYSHTEGVYSEASGKYSHAEGNSTIASGNYSHAEGYGSIANHKSQHVFGEYNIEDTNAAATDRGTYAEIVGNGTGYNSRSNARTLDWDGNEVLAGTIEATDFGTTLNGKINDKVNSNLTIQTINTLETTDKTVVGGINEVNSNLNSLIPVVKTATPGSVCSFSDGADGLPLHDLEVAITAKQSGTGTPAPDNIRPIIGVSECNVTRCGKNVWSYGNVSGTWRKSVTVDIKAGTYTISANVTSSDTDADTNLMLFYYEDRTTEGVNINRGTRQNVTFTLSKNVTSINFYASRGNNVSVGDTFSFTDIQLETGSSATSYEAYSADTYTIQLGDTYYGGSLDVTTGVLTILYKLVVLKQYFQVIGV